MFQVSFVFADQPWYVSKCERLFSSTEDAVRFIAEKRARMKYASGERGNYTWHTMVLEAHITDLRS